MDSDNTNTTNPAPEATPEGATAPEETGTEEQAA